MENEDEREQPLRPALRSVNEEFEVTDNGILITEKGPGRTPLAMVKHSELKAVEIKAAGTLYDGEVSFVLKTGRSLKFRIKKYQQEDFEILKAKLRK